MKKVIILFVVLHFFTTNSFAQKWLWGVEASSGGGEGGAVTIDETGNAYITGLGAGLLTFGTFSLTSGKDQVYYYLVKFDQSGNVLWATQSSSAKNSQSFIVSTGVLADNLGNVYVSGYFSDTISIGSNNLISPSNYNIFIAKYDSKGNIKWVTQSKTPSVSSSGVLCSLALDKSNNLYTTGYYNDTISFDTYTLNSKNGQGIYINKYDSNGKVLWVNQPVVNNPSNFADFSFSIVVDKFNSAYITGTFFNTIIFGTTTLICSSNFLDNVFIAKFDSNGHNIWAQAPGLSINYFNYLVDNEGTNISTDKSGYIYITGYYSDSLTFGNYTISPTYLTPNIFLVKYDESGNVKWAKTSDVISSSGFLYSYQVVTDTVNNLYLTFADNMGGPDTIAFDTDTTKLPFTTYDGNSIILKFDSSGNVLCGAGVTGGGDDNNCIAVNPAGNYLYFSGDLANSVRFGPDSLIAVNNEIPFIAKWEPCGAKEEGINGLTAFKFELYPNPNEGQFFLITPFAKPGFKIEIYNMLGQRVYCSNLNSDKNTIEMTNPSPGIYLYRIINMQNEFVSNGKFIIQ